MIFAKEWKNDTLEGKHTFGTEDSKVVDITDLSVGDVFFAMDNDGKFIEDEDGNTLFKLTDNMDKDICGDYLPCIPVGKANNE